MVPVKELAAGGRLWCGHSDPSLWQSMLNVRLGAGMKLEASPACAAQLGNIAICHFKFSKPVLWLAETLNCSLSLQKLNLK